MPPGWQIAPDKRTCIYWSGYLPGGWRHGSYPEAAFEVGGMPNGTCFCLSRRWLALALHRNLLILLGKLPLRQIVIKLLKWLLTEMLEVRILPGEPKFFSIKHLQNLGRAFGS